MLGRRSTRSLWSRFRSINMKEGETIIYHCYKASKPKPLPKKKGVETYFSKFLAKAARLAGAIGIALLLVSYAPSIWFSLSGSVQKLSQVLTKPLSTPKQTSGKVKIDDWQPRFDPALPIQNRLKIASIGVDTPIQEATADNLEEALKKGVWRISDFGTPADRSTPSILAAHRYGYLVWTNAFRKKNSFFNLPKLKVGSTVEIIWKQRKYTYEVYGESKGEEITDYGGDLILYTCEGLSSPIRVFKYARLLKI